MTCASTPSFIPSGVFGSIFQRKCSSKIKYCWWTMIHCCWTMVHCRWPMIHCRWTIIHWRWTMVYCCWTINHSCWTMIHCCRTMKHCCCAMIHSCWTMIHLCWTKKVYSRTTIPFSFKYSFKSIIPISLKWKMLAANAASAYPSVKVS